MGMGYLLINIYADSVGQPVENANIEITGAGIKRQFTTNLSGQTNRIELDCPDKEFSLSPQSLVKPYETYTIKAIKPGLRPVMIQGVQILDGCTSIEDIYMHSEPEKDAPPEYIMIPEHVLWGDYPPKVVVDPISQPPLPTPGGVQPFPLVPEYILVHDGLPTDTAAANYFVRFPDYIKNAASSEIYSTWPKETLKANIYAILSFTMNRIFTEWYRSKGYPFTITTSTQFDQKYIHGRNIFLEISQVVDGIFEKYMRRGTLPEPFFAQFNDGIRVNHAGWLSRWGSKDLGDRGYTAVTILKHYYGNDIFLDSTQVIEGIPNSFPGFNLEQGICSDAVQTLQNQLHVINGSYPAIPKIYPADGNYGANTKASVQAFQKVFHMPITGVVNSPTWYRISYVFVEVSKMLQGRYDTCIFKPLP